MNPYESGAVIDMNAAHKNAPTDAIMTADTEALRRQGPQDRYQLLCANCNFGKLMNGGVCPHQSKEARCA